MSEYELLDKLGKYLVQSGKDDTLFNLDSIIEGRLKSANGKKMHQELQSFDEKQIEVLRKMGTLLTDMSLHNVLSMIESSDEIDVIVNEDGNKISVKDVSDGLAGELYSEDGWLLKYSKYPSSF
tara:strand:+ start:325 stop:696 length:372 start_codon:yes stop_codon:yes gene_type:complete